MADISVTHTQMHPVNNSVSRAQINNSSNIKAFDTPDVAKDDTQAVEERKDKLREELLEDVVSVSEDGDTVQVSNDGKDKLNYAVDDENIYEEEVPVSDGRSDAYMVEVKPIHAAKDTDNSIESQDDTENYTLELFHNDSSSDTSSNITSYNGYTDTQLEQLYLKGEITKYDYDREIDARQAEREELQNDNEDVSKQVMATVSGIERVSQDAEQIQKAFAEDSAATPDAAQRVEIMTTLQDFTRFR